ncbi:antitoxin Xre/MbcA/ParS toxin-binding domain-containing protein [Massilia sp. YIM B02443]|uniref:antitoxin Xre/MbcA/ParS toxin-binding domain-containing protein n=1 Tax=Massilia sp. YIM B02443 TaxID=3050127 RepID=UPI0025B6827F|nr:antitoxin Xre/MbcA/ParS toxin-binding domain-containing protein [Massilia sp. YIM B02443]MDN4037835.1 DUF2384 domain-containing protein [Massilia sp. YIM B02443]
MTDPERPSPDNLSALQARFQQQSRKAQSYYAVMHEARGVLGSIEAADRWMNAPLAELGGRTPAQLVNDGRIDEVLACIRKQPKGGK